MAEYDVPLQADGERVTVRVRVLERTEVEPLLAAFPPDPDPDAPAKRWGRGFEPAVLQRAVVDPPLGAEDAIRAWESWGNAADELVAVALQDLADGSDLSSAAQRARHDQRFALEVEYCSAHGIRHSEFLGWSHADQAAALVGLLLARDRCPGCNMPADLMDHPELGDVATRRCEHCALLEQVRSGIDAGARGSIHVSAYPVRHPARDR